MGVWIMCATVFGIIISLVSRTQGQSGESQTQEWKELEEQKAKVVLEMYEEQMSKACRRANLAGWTYATNITAENEKLLINESLILDAEQKRFWEMVTAIDWKVIQNSQIRRQMKLLSILGVSILPHKDLVQFRNITAALGTIYSTTKICDYKNRTKCNLNLEPEIVDIFANSTDYDELKYLWQNWHEKSGRPMRALYPEYVKLANKAAKINNFTNNAEMWLHAYESDEFVNEVETIWKQLKPLYDQLHAYVRRKLINRYGKEKIHPDGPIPAHVFGNVWAQGWSNIDKLLVPFPNKSSPNIDSELKNQKFTPIKMFQVSDEFFESLGLEKLPQSFWDSSMLVRPKDRDVECHASALEFCDKKDVRIKMCTEVTQEHLFTIHHEMGHVQYFMQYKNQPLPFRTGANPGFHEAIGDTLVLSVRTPQHLREINLLPSFDDDKEGSINYLLSIALSKIAFLPFAYSMELWRWKVFKGEITEKDYNAQWWKIKKELQGIVPPVERTEEDFDPGAKHHIPKDVPYIRYFVSTILQFQFHQGLCEEAGQYIAGDPNSKPLHKCDIFRSKMAGRLFSDMMQLGRSQNWKETMMIITRGRSKSMDGSAILEYFKELTEYLKEENKKNNEFIGWKDTSGSDFIAPPSVTSLLMLLSIMCISTILSS